MGLPIPNLDDKTFDELAQEARSLIARYTPEWTDHNVHDPGITFIDLFSWLAEMQIYQLNRVTEKNYEKFLKLVGFQPLPARPAGVDITFEKITQEETIKAGTQVVTGVSEEKIVFETEEDFTLIQLNLKSIITKYDSKTIDNTEANKKDGIYFAPFGETPVEGATLELGFNNPLPGEKEIQIIFVLPDEGICSVGSHGDEQSKIILSVDLKWEYWDGGRWDALSIKKDTTLALTGSGRIVLIGPPSMDKKDSLYWIRCRLVSGHYEISPRIEQILLNTISAIQIETVKEEDLGTGSGNPEQKIVLKKINVAKGSQTIQVQREDGEWEDCKAVEDFESSGPDDLHYMFDSEKGEIIFGNGLNGRIPFKSQRIRASYKTTLGQKGNIPKGQNFQIVGLMGITGENLKEATGGKAAESIEYAKTRAKKDFRIPYRAITSADYEELALSTPGLRVARAKAIPNYNPDYPCISNFPGSVTVVVVPCVREDTITPVPGGGFIQTVLNHLNIHRLVTTDVYVIGPEYVKVSVVGKVRIKKKSSPTEVSNRIQKALRDFLNPLKRSQDQNEWPFGRSVYPSEIYQIIDKVEGVDYAIDVSLSAGGQYQEAEGIIEIPPVALVYSGIHEVEII